MATSSQNTQTLLNMGMTQEQINKEKFGDKMSDNEKDIFIKKYQLNTPAPAPAAAAPAETPAYSAPTPPPLDWSSIPDDRKALIMSDPNFASLSQDQQTLVVYNYKLQSANDADKATKAAAAFEEASKQAEPYWASILRVAQDQILRTFEQTNGDYLSSVKRQEQNIQYIKDDLASNTGYLTTQQTSELTSILGDMQAKQTEYDRNKEYLGEAKALELEKQSVDYNKQVTDINVNKAFNAEEKVAQLKTLASSYQKNKEGIINNAKDAGLSFSTKRKLAETRLSEENTGLVESTNRTFNKQLTDLTNEEAYLLKVKALAQGSTEADYAQKQADQLAAKEAAMKSLTERKDSITLDYDKKIADLNVEATKGNTEALAQIEDLKRNRDEAITEAGRTFEATYGTENIPGAPSSTITTLNPVPSTSTTTLAPTTPSYTPLGGVTGTYYDEKVKDIEARKNALLGDMSATSLNFT